MNIPVTIHNVFQQVHHPYQVKNGKQEPHKMFLRMLQYLNFLMFLKKSTAAFLPVQSFAPRIHESACNSMEGIEVPPKKALMSVRACFGLCKGTSCPAPLTVTNVSPVYSWVHPPTCMFNNNTQSIPGMQGIKWKHGVKVDGIKNYLPIIIPSTPRAHCWKLESIYAVPGGCNWDYRICITTVMKGKIKRLIIHLCICWRTLGHKAQSISQLCSQMIIMMVVVVVMVTIMMIYTWNYFHQ